MKITNEQFNEMYATEIAPIVHSVAKYFGAVTHIPTAEYESRLNYEAWLAVQKFDGEKASLKTFLYMRLKDRAKRVLYDERQSKNNESIDGATNDKEGKSTAYRQYASDINVENDSIATETIRKQRELIHVLLSSVKKLDPIIHELADRFLNGEADSVGELARTMGIHKQKVARALQYAARSYDENKFGPLSDYLSA
ncbi:hypothetical protein [Paenibacillus wulumuqiensis]|uniref:hypothetical protein n=1 Tax=Paenibacillus wulumuqiensis TaxID=1567107 RepID=UPI000619116A|nr:hypothetical protein [Paenibacillus wulumuqiensis]